MADPEPTLTGSNDYIDELLIEASCQLNPDSPHITKIPKMDGAGNAGFVALTTSTWIQQMHEEAIPVKTNQATSWSTSVWQEWYLLH